VILFLPPPLFILFKKKSAREAVLHGGAEPDSSTASRKRQSPEAQQLIADIEGFASQQSALIQHVVSQCSGLVSHDEAAVMLARSQLTAMGREHAKFQSRHLGLTIDQLRFGEEQGTQAAPVNPETTNVAEATALAAATLANSYVCFPFPLAFLPSLKVSFVATNALVFPTQCLLALHRPSRSRRLRPSDSRVQRYRRTSAKASTDGRWPKPRNNTPRMKPSLYPKPQTYMPSKTLSLFLRRNLKTSC
jgi:hypothetical protein